MLIIGGNTPNPLIITSPTAAGSSSESLANLNDVNMTLPPLPGQFLVYADNVPPDGSFFWRNETLELNGTNGIITSGTGYTRGIQVDNTVIRTNVANQVITGDLSVTGNINVGGQITQVTIGASVVSENTLMLNAGYSSVTPPATNGGFYYYRGPANSTPGLVWNEADGNWTVETLTGVNLSDPDYPTSGGGTVLTSYKIWNSGNDGAGSGLDADLLDGQNATFYQNANNINAGTLSALRLPAFSGDATSVIGTSALTLATSGVVAGTYGSGNAIPVLTVDAKGRVTAATTAALSAATNTVPGVLATATQLETTLGTVTNKAVTPFSLASSLAGKQPTDPVLTGLSSLTVTADRVMYGVDTDTFAITPLTAYGRTLIAQTDAENARAALGIPAGTVFSSFTPVQQGGGGGQLTNKVYIGWNGSGLNLQVDSTNFANNWPIAAARLSTPRTINGTPFDGTANIITTDNVDSGWVSIPLVNGFTNFPGDPAAVPPIAPLPMQCRKIGNRVTIRGVARRTAGSPGAGGEVGVLPAGFRPPSTVVHQTMWIDGSDYASQLWNAYIQADGRINAGFVYTIAGTAAGDGNCGWYLSFLID